MGNREIKEKETEYQEVAEQGILDRNGSADSGIRFFGCGNGDEQDSF